MFVAIGVSAWLAGCNSNTFRVVVRNADDLARAARIGDDVARVLAGTNEEAAARAVSRVAGVTRRFEVPAEAEDAFSLLVWNVSCDLVTDPGSLTGDDAARRLAAHAARFGLAFTGEGAQAVGDALIDALGSRPGDDRRDASGACSKLREAGF